MAAGALLMMLLCITGAVMLGRLVAGLFGLTAASEGTLPWGFLAVASVGVGLAALGIFLVTRNVALPLGGLMDAAERVAAGDYDVRVDDHGPQAIRDLARAFNTMIGRLRDHDRVRRDLMADVAHELRTPLTVMQGKLEGLLDGVYPLDPRQLQELLDETHVLSRLVEDLRTLALSESGALKLQREPTDVAALARDVARAFTSAATAKTVTISVETPGQSPPIEIDPTRVREVIGNVVTNALRHTPSGGRVTIRVTPAPSRAVTVEVRDTGAGMTPEELEHAFDRFYKGAQSRGSGLGLTIARNLVVAHGGEIHAASVQGRGTAVTFTLPAA